MKKLFLILLTGLLFIACSDSDESGENGSQKGYLTGMVVDTQGNPIANANILLENSV